MRNSCGIECNAVRCADCLNEILNSNRISDWSRSLVEELQRIHRIASDDVATCGVARDIEDALRQIFLSSVDFEVHKRYNYRTFELDTI